MFGAAAKLATVAAVIALALRRRSPVRAPTRIDLRNDATGSSTYQTSVPPLIDVADSLRRGEQVEVFTVAAEAPVLAHRRGSAVTPTTAAANGRCARPAATSPTASTRSRRGRR